MASHGAGILDDEQTISGPLVFSCISCRTIIGDSFAFLRSDEDTQTVTLSGASNIKRTEDLHTSYQSYDEGSTYFVCKCAICDVDLGRYYVTTPADLDVLRENYTFHVNAVSSYELGKPETGEIASDVEQVGHASSEDMNSILSGVQSDVMKVSRGC